MKITLDKKETCAECGKNYKKGDVMIYVTLERFSHHERTWPFCDKECYENYAAHGAT